MARVSLDSQLGMKKKQEGRGAGGDPKEATQPQMALQLFSSPLHKIENKNNKECQREDCFWCSVY